MEGLSEDWSNILSIDESMILFKDIEILQTQETWIEKQVINDRKMSENNQHIPIVTTYNNDNEIFILNEKLNTANYEIQVLQNKLEISNLKLLSAQRGDFNIEENNKNLINSTHSNIIHENNCDDYGEGENLSYNINYSSQLNNDNKILQNNDNEDKSKNEDMNTIDNQDKIDEHDSDKYDSKHEQEKYFDYVLDHEYENENKNEDEDFTTSSNDQFNKNENITKEINLFDITESENIMKSHYSDGKLKDISIKPSHEEYLINDYVTSSSNITIDMIEFTKNQNLNQNLNLEKSKDFFFSEKIISMSKKLKNLKEKLIDRRYWKKVALCVAEAAVLACAGATAIPTLDVIEKKNSSHNHNNNNNNDGNNDDEFSPFLADNRITRHLSSLRYKGSILVNEELLRTVLVMSQVRYAMLCYDMI